MLRSIAPACRQRHESSNIFVRHCFLEGKAIRRQHRDREKDDRQQEVGKAAIANAPVGTTRCCQDGTWEEGTS